VDCGKGTDYRYPSRLPFLNHIDGPECDCADGYSGKVTWGDDGLGWSTDGEGWDGPEKYGGSQGSLYWKCFEATCNITNSNHKNGPGCDCAKGYFGNVTWSRRESGCPCVDEGPACSCAGSRKGHCTSIEGLAAEDTGEASRRGIVLGASYVLLLSGSFAGVAMLVACLNRVRRMPFQHYAQLLEV